MQTSVFVVSDWHLGGQPPTDDTPGFQMCTLSGRRRLADFIRWAAGRRTPDRHVHLVVNGDVVDFLAETPFTAFTREDAAAREKFTTILRRSEEVWDALRDLVQSGSALTLLLGNHDLELSLPGPRQALFNRLGPGQVEFIYDNQALTLGPILIEHGNRYDRWNVVSHDVLRQVRSALSDPSRGSPAGGPRPLARRASEERSLGDTRGSLACASG